MIRAYHTADFDAVVDLWQLTMGDRWPLTPDLLRITLATPLALQQGRHFVWEDAGRIVGFAATQLNHYANRPSAGHILAILVRPDFRRRGIGRALSEAALDWLRNASAARVMSGGHYPRLWPGICDDMPGALAFFEACGWEITHEVFDLVRDLAAYEMPAAATESLRLEHVVIEPGTAADTGALLAFQEREFGDWTAIYRYVAGLGDYQDTLVARHPLKGIIGSLNMTGPGSHPDRIDVPWKPMLGSTLGSLGEVGVASAERGHGLGLALVAVGSALLKARGAGMCAIGFTSLVNFYGRLGYLPWRRYRIAWKTFD